MGMEGLGGSNDGRWREEGRVVGRGGGKEQQQRAAEAQKAISVVR